MRLNADLHLRAAMHPSASPWLNSPVPGVERLMLHRVGDEVAQATSIVRYAPRSHFNAHMHTGGEEFLVLEGVFQDEHGDYPAGSYVRNPPGTRHTPGSEAGAVLFVKLWQFDPQDRSPVCVHADGPASSAEVGRPGVRLLPLFKDANEDVRVEHWQADSRIELELPNGGEFLLLDGRFIESGESFAPRSWLRLPSGSRLQADVGPHGARLWAKLGHLRHLAQLGLPGQR